MIPIMDLYVRRLIEQYLQYISKNIDLLDNQFRFASENTINDIKKLIRNYEIKVRSGYPREQTQLPCIVVVIDSEQEETHGLGDSIDTGYDGLDENYLNWDKEKDNYIKEHTQMKINVRCEVWSDNAVVTSFLYSIVKLALLSTRFKMVEKGIMLPSLSGGDLEPVPEYITDVFVYRKAVILSCSYEIEYYVQNLIAGKPSSQFSLGTTIDDLSFEIDGGLDGRKENNESNENN